MKTREEGFLTWLLAKIILNRKLIGQGVKNSFMEKDKRKFVQNVEREKERNSGFCQNLSGVNRSFIMIINWHSTHCFRLLRLKNLWADMRALRLDDL